MIECFRIMILAITLMIFGNRGGLQAEIVFVAPSVLFLLIALFIFLDSERYKSYINLFIAGKCVSIFIILGWLILTSQVTIIESSVLSSDLFSMALIILIIRDLNKIDEIKEIKQAQIDLTAQRHEREITEPEAAPRETDNSNSEVIMEDR